LRTGEAKIALLRVITEYYNTQPGLRICREDAVAKELLEKFKHKTYQWFWTTWSRLPLKLLRSGLSEKYCLKDKKEKPSLRCQAHYANKQFLLKDLYLRLCKEPSSPSLPLGETGG
jgi:hypothetical protein